MPEYTVTTKLPQSAWDAFVDGAPEGTPYHRHRWGGVIAASFRHRTHYLAALDRAGAVRGVLPLVHMRSPVFGNFLVSVPFVNYGGVLCDSQGAASALLAAAEGVRAALGARHVELRHLGFQVEGLPARTHKVTMVLPLEREGEAQWSTFNPKLRNQIRKAEKEGLSCTIGGRELLDDFYRVFARNMRDLGTPVYGREFFLNVLQGFPESTRIAAVRKEGTIIAAGILSWYRDTMEMPWASSIREYKALCPNNLLYWESIRFAIDRGCTRFDFGRSTPNEGTYNFKKQWGAEPLQLYWQYLVAQGDSLPQLDPKNPKFEVAIKVWKRLPVALTRLLGPGIVRNIP